MRRERVSDDIYVFTSSLYAQVTASAVVQKEGIIVLDTLPYPEETRNMLDFLQSLGKSPIKYLVNTHAHPDHTFGNYLFDDDVQLVCHRNCWEELKATGQQVLNEAKASSPAFEDVTLRIPDIIFEDGDMVLHVGNKSVELRLMPGHTRDLTVGYVREDKVLVASDSMMPVPYFVSGDRQDFKDSLVKILDYQLESVVQGHGEVLLRGEVPKAVEASLNYLDAIETYVRQVLDNGQDPSALDGITIDQCGRSRIPLNGLVQDLHKVNLHTLYDELKAEYN
jgi:glyoxylase-like metal-dependent hydrolase (beta-lactamase superfamily II)